MKLNEEFVVVVGEIQIADKADWMDERRTFLPHREWQEDVQLHVDPQAIRLEGRVKVSER